MPPQAADGIEKCRKNEEHVPARPTRKAPRRYAFLRILRTIPVPSARTGTGGRAAADGREQRRTELAGSHGPPPAMDIGGFRQSAFWGGKPTGIYSFQTAPALEAGGG